MALTLSIIFKLDIDNDIKPGFLRHWTNTRPSHQIWSVSTEIDADTGKKTIDTENEAPAETDFVVETACCAAMSLIKSVWHCFQWRRWQSASLLHLQCLARHIVSRVKHCHTDRVTTQHCTTGCFFYWSPLNLAKSQA